MLNLLWLVPALPLVGFAILVLTPARLSHRAVSSVAVGSVGLSALVVTGIGIPFLGGLSTHSVYAQTLWEWLRISDFSPSIGLYLDALSFTMIAVVTYVGLAIHIYSTVFMASDEGYRRFFAYLNLFVASMLILVLADNLLLLYLGWEGVGLCSYLLIGFWYRERENVRAAVKAFLVTRIGDTAFAIGIFLLFTALGTLQIQPLLERVSGYPPGSALCTAAAALLLAGAVGKSAQLPLQVWLPDAMAGPTPVSALIHAATMVTAGVYLIARTHVLFALAPGVQAAVAAIGAATLLLAGFAALGQNDIKRILAYSTMSQIGYMFLALGVGAWGAAIFHLMAHAFFKALLFLAAGGILRALDDEHDIMRMGGLWHRMPVVFWSFLVGAAALAALPFITAGYYSKDLILAQVLGAPKGGLALWTAGTLGALLTGLYIFRAFFRVFFGPVRTEPTGRIGLLMAAPLVTLSLLAIVGGIVPVPSFLAPILGTLPAKHAEFTWPALFVAALSVASVVVAWVLFALRRDLPRRMLAERLGARLVAFWREGLGFDWLYERVFLRPVLLFARANRADAIDLVFEGIGAAGRFCHRAFAATQTGRVRDYASGLAAGTVLAIAIAVFLA